MVEQAQDIEVLIAPAKPAGGVPAVELSLSANINATPSKVWGVMSGADSGAKWLSVFMEGSHFEGEWKEGGEVQFIDGKGDGMLCKVLHYNETNDAASVEWEYGKILINGREESEPTEETEGWMGLREAFAVSAEKDGALLKVRTQCPESYKEYFAEKWPRAVAIIKELSENAS